jgi:hypothetical protein
MMAGLLATVAFALPAYANVIVTLSATDANGASVTGAVEEGAELHVEVLMAVDAAADPLNSVRGIQFDLTSTSESIERSGFAWALDSVLDNDSLYIGFSGNDKPSVVYTGQDPVDGFILNLSTEAVRVATLDVVVNGAGTLDVLGSSAEAALSTARVDAGFSPRETFNVATGTLTGGTLEFTIGGGNSGAIDTDGDGVEDTLDAFPNDPTETTDTDGDGVGDQADPFPNDPTQGGIDSGSGDSGTGDSFCGAGAAPAMLLVFVTLGFVRTRRRF